VLFNYNRLVDKRTKSVIIDSSVEKLIEKRSCRNTTNWLTKNLVVLQYTPVLKKRRKTWVVQNVNSGIGLQIIQKALHVILNSFLFQ